MSQIIESDTSLPTSSKNTARKLSSKKFFRYSVNCNTVERSIDLQTIPSSPQSLPKALKNFQCETPGSLAAPSVKARLNNTSDFENDEHLLQSENIHKGK
jgi:hypothetical protein